ncbi:recombinase family protein [Rhodobacteraceae bacterium RKSG542]|uniref:recombinase family protein n=1 Tax=Pseudovibrio flavus TaxID=2529854 RepID=UPI0012BCA7E3|nr:recombinase family protein [Pseudovibrio flavus]MTI16836.1 recombinase family protein [Pseudovibrio flavus]
MPTVFGYARVSTTGQDLSIQEQELKAAGCDFIRSEKVSGTSREGRDELKLLLEFVKSGDTLVVTRMDRLARSAVDLLKLVEDLKARGVELRILKQSIDTSTSEGKLFVTMLAGFAEFETELRKERQMEGIAKAKAAGKYKGRAPTIDRSEVASLMEQGMNKSAISRKLGCDVRTIRRISRELETT